MRVPYFITKLKFLRKIERIDPIFSYFEESLIHRNKAAYHEKPKNVEVNLTQITLHLPYTFENFESIHKIIIKKFKNSDFSHYIKNISEDSNNIDYIGWNSLGLIVPRNTKNTVLKYNSLIVKRLPVHTKFIKGYIHRLLPSTYVLCFDFHLDENFLKELYSDFYSTDDILVTTSDFFKKISYTSIESNEKYTKKLNLKIEELYIWLIDFFNFKEDFFISHGSIVINKLNNISNNQENLNVIKKNENFLRTQSIYISHPNTFSNDDLIFNIEDPTHCRLYLLNVKENFDCASTSEILKNIITLSIVKNYKNKLEFMRKHNINATKKTKIIKLKNETLIANNIGFQIYRFFQESKSYHIEYEIKGLIIFNLTSKPFFDDQIREEFSKYSLNFINHYETILIDYSQSINNLLEKELNALSLEVNYNLQQTIKYLTYTAISIAFLSLLITAMATDLNSIFNKIKTIYTGIIVQIKYLS